MNALLLIMPMKNSWSYRAEDFPTREAWMEKVTPDENLRKTMQHNWENAVSFAQEGKQIQFPEITLTAKDGSLRIAHRTLAIVGDDAIVAWTDLTTIRQTEQALIDSEQRFRGMVEKTVVGMYVLRDDHYLYANPSYSEKCWDGVSMN